MEIQNMSHTDKIKELKKKILRTCYNLSYDPKIYYTRKEISNISILDSMEVDTKKVFKIKIINEELSCTFKKHYQQIQYDTKPVDDIDWVNIDVTLGSYFKTSKDSVYLFEFNVVGTNLHIALSAITYSFDWLVPRIAKYLI